MTRMKRITVLLVAAVILLVLPMQAFAAESETDWDAVREIVIQALKNHEEEVCLEGYNVPCELWGDYFFSILDSDCSLWFVKRSLSYSNDSGNVYRSFFQYIDPQQEQETNAAVDEIIARCIKPGMTDVQKALVLHDYLVLNCEYDLSYEKRSAYEALVNGTSVCQGYAEAYGLLLSEVGIPCQIVSSDPMNHAWNIIQINGSWYHVDATWDDPVYDTYGKASHTYFLCSDAAFLDRGHYDWIASNSCSNTGYDSGMYWCDTESGIVFLSAQEAIIRRDGMGEFTISSRNEQTGAETVVYKGEDSTYYYDGYWWYTVTCGLSYWNGELYFGDLTNIYAMKPDGSQVRTVQKVIGFPEWNYFSGSYVKDGTLHLELSNHEHTRERVKITLEETGEHEHIWQDATCMAPKTCIFCGKTEGNALEHIPGETTRVEPTCTEMGSVSKESCTLCGVMLQPAHTIPALGHTEAYTAAVAPTCTATGLTQGAYCTVCHAVTVPQEEVAALGHSWDGGEITQEPTESVPGICLYTCLTCGETKSETVELGQLLQTSGDLDRQKPTKQQIIDFWQNLPYATGSFVEEPSVKAPYAIGKLDDSLLNSGLAYLNYIRYVAGLPEVQLSDALNENAQYGAVLLGAVDVLTHYPSQPYDMDYDFYSKGAEATSSSNISMRYGYGRINYIISSLSGCLADSGNNNLAAVGHRRWLLNPRLLNVGFGYAISKTGSHYVTTKVFDQSGSPVNYEFISWPASGYVPTNLFEGGTPWSVTLNPNLYKKPVLENLNVTLTRQSDGAVWTFNATTGGPSSFLYPYMTVNNVGYGVSNCIIFSPGLEEIGEYMGVYSVEINGLYSTKGEAKTLRYQVEFFDVGGCNHIFEYTTVEPTCTNYGYITKTCLRCGESEITEFLPSTNHTWDEGEIVTPPTEETTGVRRHTCTVCGATMTDTIPKLDHEHSYTATVTEPICILGGYTTYTCSCGYSYQDDYTHPLGHDVITDPGYDPTCTEPGLTEGGHCGRCGLVLAEQESIPASGHNWNEGVITTEPTEESEGVRTYTCSACGKEKTEMIPALEHTHKYTSETTAPTCTEAGYTTHTCACGDSYTDSEVAALGHDVITDAAKAPTCTEEGLTEGSHCGRCGEVLAKQETVAATGHSWGQWVETVKPDETRDGVNTRVCTACGETETKVIDNNIFTDVKKDRFEAAILWAYYNNITTGTGDGTTFSPENACTRKQIVTFLWRAAGEPEPESMVNPFKDVKSDRFEKAILWAYYAGITAGTGDGSTFSPENTCTRKQIVTFLWRYNGQPAPKSMENKFVDVKNDRFTAAILWAAEQGITTGTGDGTTFSPEDPCTRKQIVTFLFRNLNKEEDK